MVANSVETSAGRIEQLDEATIGRIAAGEVVERPAQVVKELLENSVDAGAGRIDVSIESGGFDSIVVQDDGDGMVADDLPLAVQRHATSKLRTVEDLSTIGTLGFRGEALASIGSVSRLTVESRPADSVGSSIQVDGGVLGEVEPAGLAQGTRISVEGLFSNVPARLAFQRRPSTETAATVDVVASHALAHPDIGFHLMVDGRPILSTPAVDDVASRLFDVLGGASDRLVVLTSPDADDNAPGEERWRGWISPPAISRGRPDDVHIFVNGRAVAATPFLKSIRRGYSSRLMTGRHPVCVLFLSLPTDQVDVNIHPTKREVRFKHSWRLLERLERAIAETLLDQPTGTAATTEFPLGAIDTVATSTSTVGPVDVHPAADASTTPISSASPSWARAAAAATTTASADIQTRFMQAAGVGEAVAASDSGRPISRSEAPQATLPGLAPEPRASALSSDERRLHRHSHGSAAVSPLDEPSSGQTITEVPAMEPLSQFADSYILAQGDDSLYVIDQHALHERIRYERLRNEMTSWHPQILIEPIDVYLSAQQAAVVRSESGRLSELGFTVHSGDVEGAGTHHLSSVPTLLVGDDRLDGFLQDLLSELSATSSDASLDSVERLQDEIAFMRSCRGAVKANQTLKLAEMRRLLDDMRTIPNPWACVHGRPTVLELEVSRLDHHFGRLG